MKIILTFLVVALVKRSLCFNEPLGKHLYEDLKCTPNIDEKSYNCNVSHEKTCLFEGKIYKTGEIIEDKALDKYCRTNCNCNDDGTFDCAEYDCPEIPTKCRYVDTLTDCCRVEDCTPATTNCTVGGTVYREGSSFSVKNECKICLCQKGFTGKLEEPYCVKQRCLEQVSNKFSLQNKCAAVYFSDDLCCPSTWVCNEKQKIVKISEKTNPELFCEFGKDKITYGYGFEASVRPYSDLVKVRCECTLPPFVTCLEFQRIH